MGPTAFASGEWVGVELDRAATVAGKNDGSVDGTSYFYCQHKMGLFVRPNRLLTADEVASGKSLDERTGGSTSPGRSSSRSSPEHRRPSTAGASGTGHSSSPSALAAAPKEFRRTASYGGKQAGNIARRWSRNSSADFESLTLGGGRIVEGGGGSKKGSRKLRSQSSIDPSQVRKAMQERSKLSREDKRARNKTTVVSPQVAALRGGKDGSPYSSVDDVEERSESIAALKRESHMRKEIMTLQKEHLKSLINENRTLVDENALLVAHAAHLQSEHSGTALENMKLRKSRSRGGLDNELMKEVISERDLAIEKIATLMEQIDDAKREISSLKVAGGSGRSPRNGRRGSVSPENPRRAGDDGAAKKMVATAAEKMAKLQHENEKLRTRLKGIKTAKIVGDVKDLIGSHMMHASLEEAYGAAVERLAELSGQNDELKASASNNEGSDMLIRERDEAKAQLATMMGLVRKLSSGTASTSFTSSVSDAMKQPTEEQRKAALNRLSWDDLDEEVSRQNALLDRTIESTSPNTTLDGDHTDMDSSRSGAGPDAQLSDLRTRLRGKLRKLLHDSNSIRIRSAALSPTKTNPPTAVGVSP